MLGWWEEAHETAENGCELKLAASAAGEACTAGGKRGERGGGFSTTILGCWYIHGPAVLPLVWLFPFGGWS